VITLLFATIIAALLKEPKEKSAETAIVLDPIIPAGSA
jgi:hypothetical protein